MDLDRAVTVMNERNHRDQNRWRFRSVPHVEEWVEGDGFEDCFTSFEAIAIAEKYERDAQPTESKEQ